MSYRFMRVIVMFDLPTLTDKDRTEYRKFRKFLVKNGFVMMQESVYTKIALNTTVADAVVFKVRKNKPMSGLVQMLTVTERQFEKMELLVGEEQNSVLDSDERLIIL